MSYSQNLSERPVRHGQVDPVHVVNDVSIVAGDDPLNVNVLNTPDVNVTNPSIPTSIDGLVDTNNSTTTLLGIDGVFTGVATDILKYSIIYVYLYSDQPSATDGLSVEFSSDGTNWDIVDAFTYAGPPGATYSFQCAGQYMRVVYTNGGVAQTEFRLQVILKGVYGKPSSHRIQERIDFDDDAELVKSVLTAENEFGAFSNVGYSSPLPIRFAEAGVDAFGRQRTSEPFTLFDSKQLIDNSPLFWDDQQVSGAGTSSTYSQTRAASRLAVSNATAGRRVRQTFRRFNYEPGKSTQVLLTFANSTTTSGLTKAVGYGDDSNGLFFVSQDGQLFVRQRSSATGVVVDTDVAQADWNYDKLDGTGESGIELDPDNSQIFFLDFEWLGVGRVRMGFVIRGVFVLCHEFRNANVSPIVYMSTPNLPLRYEIENDGTGAASYLDAICGSVMSEGGANSFGKTVYLSQGVTPVNANTPGTIYSLVGVRAKAGQVSAAFRVDSVSVLSDTVDNFEWMLILNPTIAGGGLTWSDVANYGVQIGQPNGGNPSTTTITGGTMLDGGHVAATTAVTLSPDQALSPGFSIAGVADILVLACRPHTSNADIHGSMTIRELT